MTGKSDTDDLTTVVTWNFIMSICARLIHNGAMSREDLAAALTQTANEARVEGEKLGKIELGDGFANTLENMAALTFLAAKKSGDNTNG